MRAGRFGVVLIVASSLSAAAQARKSGAVELALTYSGDRSNTVQDSSFWSQGGTLALSAQLYGPVSIVAEGSGAHSPGAGKYLVPYDTMSVAFGPRFTLPVPRLRNRFSVFGQGLVGEVHGVHGVFPSPSDADSSALALATEAGGGIDVRVRRHFALRAFQADWVRTQLPNGTSNVQNNLRLGAGLVLRLQSSR